MHKQGVKKIEWVLRIAIALTFFAHGYLALEGPQKWISYLETVGFSANFGAEIIQWIGILDMMVALSILIKPYKYLVLWAFIWTLSTALIRPISGEPIWEFIERSANWGAPLALFILLNYRNNQTQINE